jgi:uncharacterized membrane-anchored protein YitT (DUF2179 family)
MKLKEYFFGIIGALLIAVGLDSFLIPHNIAAGGASGMAVVLHHYVNLPVGVWMYIINAVLFVISFLFIGKEFGLKSIIFTFVVTFFVDFFNRIVPIPIYPGKDLFLSVFFGISISAFGMGIVFVQNASTGGTDILARLLNKFTGLKMGIGLMGCDLLIALGAGQAYSLNIGLYSMASVIINGIVVDYVIKELNSSIVITIISDKYNEISDFILYELKRGATSLNATGVYSKKEKKLMYVALNKREKSSVINKIKEIDPSAFIVVQEASNIIGYGFGDFKSVL